MLFSVFSVFLVWLAGFLITDLCFLISKGVEKEGEVRDFELFLSLIWPIVWVMFVLGGVVWAADYLVRFLAKLYFKVMGGE